MSAARWYYICDHCGNVVTIEASPIPEGQSWECADCGSSALWEFESKENALQHSRHIQRLVKSALFRRVS
jgi:DNA-directed RNA polymerase subunit RPC12/RpoP